MNARHAIAQDSKDGVMLTVHVQPKASRTECAGMHGGAVKIRVAAPPIDGAANDELIRFLAECCAIPRAGISIQAGVHSRHKRVRIKGVTAERVLARLMPTLQKGASYGLSGVRAGAMLGALFLAGCSAAHPVLYPNAHLQSVGQETAEQDVEACKQAAESAGASADGGKAGHVATKTAVGAGVGAASGAVGGAISGAAGRGSMIGAASGAVWGLLMGLFSAAAGPSQPSQAYTNFVNRCLQEKGYEVTGWQ